MARKYISVNTQMIEKLSAWTSNIKLSTGGMNTGASWSYSGKTDMVINGGLAH